MKINFFYKTFHLGTLEKENKTYIYNSNQEEEKLALEKYIFLPYYNLQNSKNLKSEVLFPIFKNIVTKINLRNDIKTESNILASDDDFEIIKKFALIQQNKNNYNFNLSI